MALKLMYKDDPMFDQDFLNDLFSAHERELYAKIVALNLDEEPIEEIQGRVTSGSAPVDGNSIVRRTCSLSIVASELDINDYIWGLKTKIKLFIGLKNKINSKYPDIIWFKMGTYILTSFSTSLSASGYTVSIQGKDKMCLLNGDVGGNLTALSYDFGSVEVVSKSGYAYSEKLPLKQIIKKAVHDFAKEPYHNIVINDLDDCGLELLEYRGTKPMYFIYKPSSSEVVNMVIDENQSYYVDGVKYSIKEIEAQNTKDILDNKNPTFIFKVLTGDTVFNGQFLEPTKFYGDADGKQEPYNIIKIETGMTCGYRTTELVYAGQLTSAVGEPITAMLSKIVSMLGNYEYFYNRDGQFIFQKKRTYVNTSWNNMVNNGEEDWVENAAYTSSYTFSFENGNLITSFQNSPNLANLKNDFSIWGTRTGISGAAIPIHLRYAIDTKPMYYTSIDGTTYTTRTEEQVKQDKKNFQLNITHRYEKTPSEYGLSEDWWEVRDWANAWIYSGYEVPTKNLGAYCPLRARLTTNKSLDGTMYNNSNMYSYIDPIKLKSFFGNYSPVGIDDLIFMGDHYFTTHGGCAHSYTWWLQAFEEGGQYAGGKAYFFKPTMPADDIGSGEGLKLGDDIKYSLDWRELIYRMALDFNKHGDEDDFLATIREKNPTFYPTGYTGYEQYYVDMEGFWRQLYDPEYKTSYQVINLTKKQYEDEARFHAKGGGLEYWYYDAPIYTRCKEEDPFFSSVNYYCLVDSEYKLQQDLTQLDYGQDPTQYYRITDTEIKPIPIEITTTGIYYIRNDNGAMIKWSGGRNPDIQCYNRFSKSSYFPCYQIEAFVSGRLYFTLEKDEYKPATNLKKDIYMANPGKYYKKTLKGGVIQFENCTTLQPFDSARKYYWQDEKKGDLSLASITKDNYEAYAYKGKVEKIENGEENHFKLLYEVNTYTYQPVYHPKYAYDENTTYYIEGEKEYYLDKDKPDNLYWNKMVDDSPESLNFWFDFLDTYGDLSQYSVHSIGDRPKAVNDNNVKAIYFRETPGVIFVENLNNLDLKDRKTGYTYAQLPSHLEYLFTISGQGKSAKDVLDSYLYTYSYCTESITISALPIYSLEPNTRIFVRDDKSGINGEYIVSKINFPLDANGTMSINATKVVDRIY